MTSPRIPVEFDVADMQDPPNFLAVPAGHSIRTGDHVLHRPSGEEWVVAYADYSCDELSACGWPDGIARISDCEICKVASDEEHLKWLGEVLKSGDRRGRRAKAIYCPNMDPDIPALPPAPASGAEAKPYDWLWYGEDADGKPIVSLGRWRKHSFQHPYELSRREDFNGYTSPLPSVDEAVAAEREACAQIVENAAEFTEEAIERATAFDILGNTHAIARSRQCRSLAAAIRARHTSKVGE